MVELKEKTLTLIKTKHADQAEKDWRRPGQLPPQGPPTYPGTVARNVQAESTKAVDRSAVASTPSRGEPRPPLGALSSVGGSAAEERLANGQVSPGKLETVNHFVRVIGENCHKALEALLNIGRACARADKVLSGDEKRELLGQLNMNAPTFSKWVKIGNDARLRAETLQEQLPPRQTILYSIACLTEADFRAALSQRIIRPDMRRDDLKRWLASRQPRSQAVSSSETISVAQGRPEQPKLEGQPAMESAAPRRLTDPVERLEPVEDLDAIPDFLSRRSLSGDERCALDDLEAAWKAATELVRERFMMAHRLSLLR
jgi:hypothetical protein